MADETDLRLYLADHDLRGVPAPRLAGVHPALGEAVHRGIWRGVQIWYGQRIDAAEEQRYLCLFKATAREVARAANDLAQSSRRL